MTRQHKRTEYQKKNGHKQLHSILLIVDGFADSKNFSRNSPLLSQLYVRGRHKACCKKTITQKFNPLGPIILVNSSRQLVFFRFRNYKGMETMVEEFSAVLIKNRPQQTLKTSQKQRN